MKNVRLKMGIDPQQLENRLKYNPEIIELHINEENLYEPEEIVKYIHALKSKGVRVYLHHPTNYRGFALDIISPSQEMRDYYDWSCKELAMICKQESIKCVVHCHYAQSESSQYMDTDSKVEMRKRVEEILRICDHSFLWENTTQGIFSAQNPCLLSEIVQPLNLPLTIDISHSFISLKGDNHKLKNHLEEFHSYAQYYHLVDSNGEYHDALPLGKGKIDWSMVKRFVKDADFIFEIDLKSSNYMDCRPMVESGEYYLSL